MLQIEERKQSSAVNEVNELIRSERLKEITGLAAE